MRNHPGTGYLTRRRGARGGTRGEDQSQNLRATQRVPRWRRPRRKAASASFGADLNRYGLRVAALIFVPTRDLLAKSYGFQGGHSALSACSRSAFQRSLRDASAPPRLRVESVFPAPEEPHERG